MYKVWNALFKLNPSLEALPTCAFLTAEGLTRQLNRHDTFVVCQQSGWVSNLDCKEFLLKNKPLEIYILVRNDYWQIDLKSKDLDYIIYVFKKGYKGLPDTKWLAPPKDKYGFSISPQQANTKTKVPFRFKLNLSKT